MRLTPSFVLLALQGALFASSALAAPPQQARDTLYLPALNAPSQGRKAEHKASGKHGVVSTEVDVCSNVGADILQKGGSAADAVSSECTQV